MESEIYRDDVEMEDQEDRKLAGSLARIMAKWNKEQAKYPWTPGLNELIDFFEGYSNGR